MILLYHNNILNKYIFDFRILLYWEGIFMLNKFKKNLPNVITSIRFLLALSIPFMYLEGYKLVSIVIFIIASISDAIDGYLARKWNVVSNYGKIVDPFADKVLSIGVMILIVIKINQLVYIPLILELIIIIIGLYGYKNIKQIDIEKVGKVKTAVLFPTIAISLATPVIHDLSVIIVPMIGATIVLQILTIKEYYKRLHISRENYRLVIEEDSTITFIKNNKYNGQ